MRGPLRMMRSPRLMAWNMPLTRVVARWPELERAAGWKVAMLCGWVASSHLGSCCAVGGDEFHGLQVGELRLAEGQLSGRWGTVWRSHLRR